MNDRWISVGEIAQRLSISRPTATKYLRIGAIPGLVDHLGYQRVDRKAFETWKVSRDRVSSVKS